MAEIISLSVKEVSMYQLPPRTSNKGFRAADWKLDKPAWQGVLRVVSADSKCYIRLLDKNSGELFAQCDVDEYPGKAVEPVTDSSRYYALRLDDGSGRKAFIGLGFTERSDSFDFNVALRDHFKHEENAAMNDSNEPYVAKHATGALSGPIKINIKKKKKENDEDGDDGKSAAPTVSLGKAFGGLGLAAPPDLWGSSGPPAGAASNPFEIKAPESSNPFGAAASTEPSSNNPFSDATSTTNPFNNAAPKGTGGGDDWGDFSTASTTSTSNDWVKF